MPIMGRLMSAANLNPASLSLPGVSVLLAVRNESEHLDECLRSILALDYPRDLLEIIIVDGASTDGTIDKLRAWCRQENRIRVYENPQRLTAAGMNIALAQASHDLCLWISGHALIEPNHLRCAVETLEETGAAAVGGVLRTEGTTTIGKINAAVLSHRFGVGNAPHRVATQSGWVSTVTMALYRKKAIVDVWGFNENLPRNQDNELHERMNLRGYRSYLDIRIQPVYLCRNTLGGLLRQAWKNGYWNIMMTRMGHGGLSIRHFVPMAFVGSVLLTALGGLLVPKLIYLAIAIVATHLLCAIVFSIVAAIRRKLWWQWLVLPLWFVLLHWSYGLASWNAALRRSPRK